MIRLPLRVSQAQTLDDHLQRTLILLQSPGPIVTSPNRRNTAMCSGHIEKMPMIETNRYASTTVSHWNRFHCPHYLRKCFHCPHDARKRFQCQHYMGKCLNYLHYRVCSHPLSAPSLTRRLQTDRRFQEIFIERLY